MREVKYDNSVIIFLNELTDILLEKGYFSFYETSVEYMWDMLSFVKENIENLPHKPAPSYFAKYGKNLFYISYKRNHQTTWYILFEKTTAHYLVRYITNNHVAGSYF